VILDANDPESLNIVVAECNRLRAEHAEKLRLLRWEAAVLFVLGFSLGVIGAALVGWAT
jgi:hypothetical protein